MAGKHKVACLATVSSVPAQESIQYGTEGTGSWFPLQVLPPTFPASVEEDICHPVAPSKALGLLCHSFPFCPQICLKSINFSESPSSPPQSKLPSSPSWIPDHSFQWDVPLHPMPPLPTPTLPQSLPLCSPE